MRPLLKIFKVFDNLKGENLMAANELALSTGNLPGFMLIALMAVLITLLILGV